jgi:hypothetical protein
LQIKTKIVTCHTADSKPVKQEVNGTVIVPPLVFPAQPIVLKFPNRTNLECLSMPVTWLFEYVVMDH